MTSGGPEPMTGPPTLERFWWEERWPWRALGAAMGVGALYVALRAARLGGAPGAMADHVGVGAALALWLFFTAWTWRRVSVLRLPDGAEVRDPLLIGWVVLWAIPMSLIGAAGRFRPWSWERVATADYWLAALFQLVVTLPIALWGGWLFARILRRGMGR